MLISEMSKQECGDLLEQLGFGRLACAYKIIPTSCRFTSHTSVIASMGLRQWEQKIEWMRSNPYVCVEADEVRSHVEWTSVVVQGRYEELPDTSKYAKPRQKAQALLEKRSMWWQTAFAAAQTRRQVKQDIPVFYCIRIDGITGHRASPDPAPVSIG